MSERTLEQLIKFDSGLTIGVHCVLFTHKGKERKGLVEIGKRGKVSLLLRPNDGDMYSIWNTVKGDTTKNDGAVIVWGARDKEFMNAFDVPIVATIEVPTPKTTAQTTRAT